MSIITLAPEVLLSLFPVLALQNSDGRIGTSRLFMYSLCFRLTPAHTLHHTDIRSSVGSTGTIQSYSR